METDCKIITSIEKQPNRQRYHIYVNGLPAFNVHEDILVKHRLSKGRAIDPDLEAAILRDEEYQQAYLDALRWLGVKARTRHEIMERLMRKGYAQAAAEEALRRLEAQGYVNDADFARRWADERLRVHKRGRRWIRQELKEKGLSEEHIHAALAELDEQAEAESALELARKRWRSLSGGREDSGRKRKQKVMAYLLRRGFSPEAAAEAVRTAAEEQPDETDGTEEVFGDWP